ncbi:MAG: adenylate/guanylate cyclase domain-containing protein [Thermodesulfobacteriota bacterium]
MQCPKCQSENREGVKFCEECGAKFEIECPKCNAGIPAGKKFCGECGHNLHESAAFPFYSKPHSYTPKHLADKILTSRSALEGERKLVTVLFADVADYTVMSEKLDPEEVHEIMDGCFRILMDEIHRYEGTINQFTGDGVMALFGAPVAHEDHALRACHAALSIQKALSGYGEKIAKEYVVSFVMRIGLNSGPVIVGAIGDDLRMDYTAVGDTTNLAARMQSLAKPGRILLTEHTCRLIRNYFDIKPIGKLAVKGKKAPQEAFELVKPGKAATRIEASAARGFTKFVGRKNSIIALMESYEKVKSGIGQVVGIVGEAGVGKSRLILEFKNHLPHEEFTYLEGQCAHYGNAIPYLPLLDIVRSYFDIREDEREVPLRKRIKETLPGLEQDLEAAVAPICDLLSLQVEDKTYFQLESKERKERVFEALRNLLSRISQDRPLVLVIEDLHWVDKTTEEFLDYFIRWMAGLNVMLVLLYRPEYTHQWGSKSYFNRIGVEQLSLQSSTNLVAAILEGGEAAPELNEIILARAAGNPLFMEEFTHSLLENGAIRKAKDQYVLARKLSDLQVPDTVQGIIAARIDRLEENLKIVMQVAAVIGREFSFRILQAIVGMREELKSHLLNLQGLEFIYEKSLFPELEYIFKHALTQEVAYNSLLLKKRKEIHKQIGAAIENNYAGRVEEFYEILAYHYSNSDDSVRAVHYLKLSGDKAMKTYALDEAFRFYGEAYGIFKKMQDTDHNKRERIDIILSMAPAMRILAYPGNSFDLLRQGEVLCRELEDRRSSAIIQTTLGSFYSSQGDASQGMKYQQEAFEEAEKLQDSKLMILLGTHLCFSYDFAGEHGKIKKTAPKLIELLEKNPEKSEFFGTPVDLHPVLIALYGHALGYLGEFDQGERECEKALVLAKQCDNPYSLGWVEFLYGCQYVPKGDGANAVKHLQVSVQYFEELKAVAILHIAQSLLATGYQLLGKNREAQDTMQKVLEVQSNINAPGLLSIGHLAMSLVHLDSNQMEEAKAYAKQALDLGQTHHERFCEGLAWTYLGRITGKMEAAKIKEAEQYILKGIEILEDLGTKPTYATGYFILCELYLSAGRIEEGIKALKKSEEMFSRMGMEYWLTKARDVLAMINHGQIH